MSFILGLREPAEPWRDVENAMRLRRSRQLRGWRRITHLKASAALLVIGFGTGLSLWPSISKIEQSRTLRLAQPGNRGGQVVLRNSSAERNLGYLTVTGSVRNQTRRTFTNVEAIVELTDCDNNTVAVESALLPLDPLPAGGIAPFRVEMRDQPHAASYEVHFRRLLGPSLD